MPVPVEVSLNCTLRGAVPLNGLPVKWATGAGTLTVMYPVTFFQAVPLLLVAEWLTEYIPGFVKVWVRFRVV